MDNCGIAPTLLEDSCLIVFLSLGGRRRFCRRFNGGILHGGILNRNDSLWLGCLAHCSWFGNKKIGGARREVFVCRGVSNRESLGVGVNPGWVRGPDYKTLWSTRKFIQHPTFDGRPYLPLPGLLSQDALDPGCSPTIKISEILNRGRNYPSYRRWPLRILRTFRLPFSVARLVQCSNALGTSAPLCRAIKYGKSSIKQKRKTATGLSDTSTL